VEEFRYYCLHDDGHFALGENVIVDSLDEAISQARIRCSVNDRATEFHFVEVWQGAKRVFTDYGQAADAA
jgi:hypothetical protein